MPSRGIDDMGEDEYVHDEVSDIKTNAVEISATSRQVPGERKLPRVELTALMALTNTVRFPSISSVLVLLIIAF